MRREAGAARTGWLAKATHARTRPLLLGCLAALIVGLVFAANPHPLLAPSQSQSPKTWRVAYLDNARSDDRPPDLPAFADELRRLGYAEQDLSVTYHFADGDTRRLAALAAELVGADVDVIVAFGTQASQAAQKATCEKRIPVVSSGSDPVGAGVVKSLARPGQRDAAAPGPTPEPTCTDEGEWNVTGLASGAKELAGKRLELLKELLRNARSVGVLWNPDSAGDSGEWDETQAAAALLGLSVVSLEVRERRDIPEAFAKAQSERVDAVAAFSSTILNSNSTDIVSCAAWARLPAIYALRVFVERGGLMAYGPDFAERYRRAAALVDRILKGARPAQLSIEKAQRFELVFNGQTARELDLMIPRSLRVQVDEVLDRPVGTPAC